MYSATERIGVSKPFSSCETPYPFAETQGPGLAARGVGAEVASQTPCPNCSSSLQLETPLSTPLGPQGPREPAVLYQVPGTHQRKGEPHGQSLRSLGNPCNACVLVCLSADTGSCFCSQNVQNSSEMGG